MNYNDFLSLINSFNKIDMAIAQNSGIPFDNIKPIATEYVKSIPLNERIVAAVPHTYFSFGKGGRLPDAARPYVTSVKHAISLYLREWQYNYAKSTRSSSRKATKAGQEAAQQRVSAFYDQSRNFEHCHIEKKVLSFGTLDDIISNAISNKLPDVGDVKTYKRNCLLKIKKPLLRGDLYDAPQDWEQEYITIINLLNKYYLHLETSFNNLREVSARQLSDKPFNDSEIDDHRELEETAFGSARSQTNSVIPDFEKLVAAYYSATNVALARIEDYSFKPLFEIAAYVGHLRFWQTPPQLSKQAHLVLQLWRNEVAENGQSALSSEHWYTKGINFLLSSDSEIQKTLPETIKNNSISISHDLNNSYQRSLIRPCGRI